MAVNPLLRLARSYLPGRLGIPRYETDDEHPLTAGDMSLMRAGFGTLEVRLGQMDFFRLLDRQVFRFRSRVASTMLGALDDLLFRFPFTNSCSYHQVLVVKRRWSFRAPAGGKGPFKRNACPATVSPFDLRRCEPSFWGESPIVKLRNTCPRNDFLRG
jgi:hypothetical protein